MSCYEFIVKKSYEFLWVHSKRLDRVHRKTRPGFVTPAKSGCDDQVPCSYFFSQISLRFFPWVLFNHINKYSKFEYMLYWKKCLRFACQVLVDHVLEHKTVSTLNLSWSLINLIFFHWIIQVISTGVLYYNKKGFIVKIKRDGWSKSRRVWAKNLVKIPRSNSIKNATHSDSLDMVLLDVFLDAEQHLIRPLWWFT